MAVGRLVVTIFEQVVRISLMLLFVVYFGWGMIGAVVCYNIALILKDVLTVEITRRKIMKFRFYWWNLYVAPTIMMLAVAVAMRVPAGVLWNIVTRGDPEAPALIVVGDVYLTRGMVATVSISAVSGFIGVILAVFLAGFLHALDENLFNDLLRSLGLVGPIGRLASLIGIPWAYEVGRRLSPFKKFRVDIYEQAKREMELLNRMKSEALRANQLIQQT